MTQKVLKVMKLLFACDLGLAKQDGVFGEMQQDFLKFDDAFQQSFEFAPVGSDSVEQGLSLLSTEYLRSLANEISEKAVETSTLLPMLEIHGLTSATKMLDLRIEKLPFDSDEGIELGRKQQLLDQAQKLIKEHALPGETPEQSAYSFKAMGETLTTIAKMQNTTEREKAFLWDSIMSQRDETYSIGVTGLNQSLLDSSSPWDFGHAFPKNGFHDYYHCQLAELEPSAASKRIYIHALNEAAFRDQSAENKEFLSFTPKPIVNYGDITASEAQVEALRRFKEKGFVGYAQVWRDQFLHHDA